MLRTIFYFTLVALLYWIIIRWLLRRARRKNTIGIFHIHCSAGGGGERVLWHAVKSLLREYPKHSIFIYTENIPQQDSLQVLLKVRDLFDIDLLSETTALERLEFVSLSLSHLVEAKKYPFLTLLLQNLMSMIVSIQAAYYVVPEIYLETIGYTFTLPIFRLAGCKIITYVHYPTISSDMVRNVETSTHASFNNRMIFVRIPLLRKLKLVYYKFLIFLYRYAGRCADLVIVNSSWTQKHIESLWNCEAHIVYPPCDVRSFQSLSLERFKDSSQSSKVQSNLNIVSISQFRPEKKHQEQIEAFDMFLSRAVGATGSRLTLFGGCRNDEDKKRVDYLRDLINRLDLGSRVSIVVNASFDELLDGLNEADVAIHTMVNEHFGIVVLEFMAAGLITVAHKSGGPLMDIIDDGINGFLCGGLDEYADTLASISKMSHKQRQELRREAVEKSNKFSDSNFNESFSALLRNVIT